MTQGWGVIVAVATVVLLSGEASAQAPKSDTLVNGVVNGALVGGGSAFAFVKIAEARCGPGCEGPDGPLALQATIGGAGIGSVVGLVIDMAIKPKRSSPSIGVSPTISSKRKAVTMRVRW
jgi:hypothetical protein